MKLELSRQIFEKKKSQISNLMKIRPARKPSSSIVTGGQADMMKLIGAFRNVVHAPKNNEDTCIQSSVLTQVSADGQGDWHKQCTGR
jgi:hypothetical protein